MKRSELEDGKLLKKLMDNFSEEESVDSFRAVLLCLRDSYVWVTGALDIPEDEGVSLVNSVPGEEIANLDSFNFIPDVLETEDRDVFLPVFLSLDEVDESFAEGSSILEKHFVEVMDIAECIDSLAGIIIDPFERAFSIDKDLFAMIRELPSIVEEDE